jgi:hypothetical protein
MMLVPWCGLATNFKEDLSRGSYYEKEKVVGLIAEEENPRH